MMIEQFFENRDSGMLSLVVNTLTLKSLRIHLIEDGKGEVIERREIWTMMTNGIYSARSYAFIVLFVFNAKRTL